MLLVLASVTPVTETTRSARDQCTPQRAEKDLVLFVSSERECAVRQRPLYLHNTASLYEREQQTPRPHDKRGELQNVRACKPSRLTKYLNPNQKTRQYWRPPSENNYESKLILPAPRCHTIVRCSPQTGLPRRCSKPSKCDTSNRRRDPATRPQTHADLLPSKETTTPPIED